MRFHREGENAPYTGLKPAGIDFGPVLPIVDKAVETGDPEELIHTLQHAIKDAILEKFEHVQHFPVNRFSPQFFVFPFKLSPPNIIW